MKLSQWVYRKSLHEKFEKLEQHTFEIRNSKLEQHTLVEVFQSFKKSEKEQKHQRKNVFLMMSLTHG